MTSAHTTEPRSRRPLRLWPGVVAVVVLFAARFGVKAIVPGFGGFALGMQWALGAALAVVLWWAFFSRARWSERLAILAVMILGMAATWTLKHESMGPLWFLAYLVPLVCLALVATAAATRHRSVNTRRAAMTAAILLACGVWTLIRTEGISGDHSAEFNWRWAKSPEERLLAQTEQPPTPTLPPETAERPNETDAPAKPATGRTPSAPAATGAAPPPPPVPEPLSRPEWPGFRGPRRDSVMRGVRVTTDWSAAPPVEIWRRPIGPGWSSFAVRGDLFYTQEQRGDHESVACYRVSTGKPVWTHQDAARFFESNGGAGPRATPTLSDDRVYTFGATGILNALNAHTGAMLWSRNAASDAGAEIPYWGFSSSPLVVGDAVIVAASGRLVAYEMASGKPRWVGPAGGVSYSSPHLMTIDGVPQVLLVSETGVTSVAPADGKRLWEHSWEGLPIVQPALTAEGDVLIVAGAESGTRRIAVARRADGWTVEERWTSRGLKPYFNDFVVHEGHAFGLDGRILACIDLEDGTRKWKGGRYGNGQLVLLPEQDVLLLLSDEGELALVEATAERFQELARFKAIDGKTWNHPVLVGNVVLVRNGEEMAAFRLPHANMSR
jgi:outer membrane protein assembly factor BamB